MQVASCLQCSTWEPHGVVERIVGGHYKPSTGRLGWHFLQALLGNSRESWFHHIDPGRNQNNFENVESKMWKPCDHSSCYILLCCTSFGERLLLFRFHDNLIDIGFDPSKEQIKVACSDTKLFYWRKKFESAVTSIWSGLMNHVRSLWFLYLNILFQYL